MRNNEIKNEIYETKKWKKTINRKDLRHEAKKLIYDFQQHETIRSFDESICTHKVKIVEAEEDRSNLLKNSSSRI